MKLGKQLFRQTVLSNALTIAFAAGVSTVAVVPSAFAQSNTTGNISGTVAAKAGTTIVVTGIDNGVKRNAAVEANGTYRLTSVPIGNYRVQLMNGNTVVGTREVEVRIAQDSDASFAASGSVQTVEVTGRRRAIDVKASNSGSSFTSKELQALPLAPTVANVVQLAGGTTRGDYRFGNNAASFGGSSASENAAYINGFPVTSSLYQVGYSSLPFNSIANAQIITGGYGAEFGRSTGGVVNITTKSGSNRWEMGIGASYAPDRLRGTPKNIMYPVTGFSVNASTDGKIYNYKAGDKESQVTYNGYISGPIIKDKLFFYFAGEVIHTERETARLAFSATTNATQGWLEQDSKVPRSLTKIDWNITDNHHLEYTRITDKSEVDDRYYGFSYSTLQRNNILGGGAHFINYASGVLGLNSTGAAMSAAQGSNVDILKYTAYLTDDLTVQALIGQAKTPHKQIPFGYTPGLRPIAAAPANRAPGVNYIPSNPQGFTSALLREDAGDKNEGLRLDVEYKWNQHTIRGGIDYNKITATNGTEAAGGGTWTYLRTENPTAVPAGWNLSPAQGGGFGPQGFYVQEGLQRGGSKPSVKQSAQYIEDRYQLNKDLLLTFGLRNEAFNNLNGQGKTFVEQKNMLAPRFSAAWDVYGDASLKVFGTLGRYHMQLPANMAVRFAAGSLNTSQYYTYTGVDPVTGAPQGLKALSGVISPNGEFGIDPDPSQLAAVGLKAHFQDEINIGFEKAITPNYNGGVKFTFRDLKSTIDDYSDFRPIEKKLGAAKAAYVNDVLGGWHGALFNPGEPSTFLIPISATQVEAVTISPAEQGFEEKPKRRYMALEFMVEHPMRDGWYGKVNYTWSKNWGNHEGQTKSDNGQPDVGFSSGWDFPELMINGGGLLPNNRTHQLKAYGLYQITPEWNVGGNLLVATGRPISKTCNLPAALDTGIGIADYSPVFYLCKSLGYPSRGSVGSLPTDTRLDLNVIYKPAYVPGLALKVDVLNVFDRQVATAVDEGQEVRFAGTTPSPTANMVLSYSTPRSVRFTVQYDKKF